MTFPECAHLCQLLYLYLFAYFLICIHEKVTQISIHVSLFILLFLFQCYREKINKFYDRGMIILSFIFIFYIPISLLKNDLTYHRLLQLTLYEIWKSIEVVYSLTEHHVVFLIYEMHPIIPDTDGSLCYLAPSMFQDSKVINIIVSLHYLLHLALLMIYILFWICLPLLFPCVSIVHNIWRNVLINFFLTLLISKHPRPTINLKSCYIL